MRHWLFKSEPDAYSIDDLRADGTAGWDGVRNYQARNLLRDEIQPGDLVLFYHSNTKPPGVVGVAQVVRGGHPDPTQFDSGSPGYDAKARPEAPRWYQVEIAFVAKLPEPVTLQCIKEDPVLREMMVARRGMRLSVQPVEEAHFARVVRLGGLDPSAFRSPRATGH